MFFIIFYNIHLISTSSVFNENLKRKKKKEKKDTKNLTETMNCQERKVEISQIFHRNAFERSFHVSRTRAGVNLSACNRVSTHFHETKIFFQETSACSSPPPPPPPREREGARMRLHGCYIFSRCLLVHVSRFLEVKTASRKLIYGVNRTRCFLLLVCDREVF